MSRPVVGIGCSTEVARWGGWEVLANVSPRTYSLAVQAAGATAVLLPPDDSVAESPDDVLDLVDALILAGGSDIDPASYGAPPHPEVKLTWPERDRFELALTHRALERDMPVLGICRGMQMLNVACGGTLIPHVDRTDIHRHTPGTFSDHSVELEPGSLAARAAGAERTDVRSHHHQAVDELGEGLVVSGRAVEDGMVEAIEIPERSYALGVLWHPEEDERSRVVGSLVAEVRAKAGMP